MRQPQYVFKMDANAKSGIWALLTLCGQALCLVKDIRVVPVDKDVARISLGVKKCQKCELEQFRFAHGLCP